MHCKRRSKDPVKFKNRADSSPSDTEAEVVFTATMDKGWHVYSTDLGDGGTYFRNIQC